ncbi:MAG: type IV pilin protein [Psychrosphaera sp.]|nr:type IV pilin protein [Psychrosphaera sp.]
MKNNKGFTLIELMIGVAIVGILASIAYPSYTDSLNRARRAEAMTELVRVANMQEQYFADNRTYAIDMTKLGFSTDPYITENGYYSIDTAAITAITTDYLITATAAGLQSSNDGACTTFSLNYLGQKTAKKGTVDNTNECWDK